MAWSHWFHRRPKPTPDPSPPGITHQLLAEINRYRASWKLPPLQLDQKLCEQAQHHSIAQAKMDLCSHFGPYGTNPLTRAYMAGYGVSTVVCENIAEGFATPIVVARAWYCSAPHRANLLHRHCQLLGVGVEVQGSQRYWTVTLVGTNGDTTMASLAGPLIRTKRSVLNIH